MDAARKGVTKEKAMAMRQIIEIDEAKCDGCGECAQGCPEGALRIIDGKARLVGESLCDGLGACIGTCPQAAITITEREAEEYDEAKVMDGIVRHGPNVIRAHIEHLEHHGQDSLAAQAKAYLADKGIPLHGAPLAANQHGHEAGGGCPGSHSRMFRAAQAAPARAPNPSAQSPAQESSKAPSPSALGHWPIQLHLINPRGPQYAGAKLLVAADCTAFALGSFHTRLLEGHSLVIACPKLDQGREVYVEKLSALIAAAESVEVAIMEVPCCGGLLKLVLEARERNEKKPPIEAIVVGIEGSLVGRSTY